MGYCFGVDYIVVYRSSPTGDQLLGNSSNENMPHTPPADLQGRTRISKDINLLGLQIGNLTHSDSGIYRRECWQNQMLVNQHTQQLFVCNEEIEAKEIIENEGHGGAEILCNNTSIGLEGFSVSWYLEVYPSYRPTLFLDSSVSLEPLVKELQGAVEVRESGALLMLNSSLLKNNQHFYCLVIKGTNCLSFQNMYLPSPSENREIFASQGDKVVLNCPADGNDQQWDTPLGRINDSSVSNTKMYISVGKESEDFSLVIPHVSEEHSGEYSCASTVMELQYSLTLCPKKQSNEKVVLQGGNVSLECSSEHGDLDRVQWYRNKPSGQQELIHDSQEETVAIPEDLSGRLTLSESGSSLMISDLVMGDQGEYCCVVLSVFLKYYKEDYDNEEDAEYHGGDWHDNCVSKQETILIILKQEGGVNSKPVTFTPVIPAPVQPSEGPDVMPYAVGGGLVALLVAGVIVAVIVVKKKAKASPGQSDAASRSGVHEKTDPGCTERLTHNDNVYQL